MALTTHRGRWLEQLHTLADELAERDMVAQARAALKEEDERLPSARGQHVSLSLAESGAD